MINTNLYSAYYVTKALLPKMMPYKKGNIINICSVAALQPYANGGSYSISKYALQGFSKNLREEMKPFNIKVTSIHPGATWSHSWQGVDLPKDRLMEAEDVAKTVVAITQLSASAVMEDVVLRPQLGDL
jgi:short-subunit dehydrogenase